MSAKNIFHFLLLASLVSGCTTPDPTYNYVPTSPQDPKIKFDSDFVFHTFFSVNTNIENTKKCSDFETVGYILKKDSIFIYDKPSLDVSIKTAPNRNVTVKALHEFDDSMYHSICGPLYRTFIPIKGEEYLVTLKKEGDKCFLSIQHGAVGNRSQTPSIPFQKCLR